MSAHTPTPWRAWQHQVIGPPEGYQLPNGARVAMCYGERMDANAAHIVKCINVHDSLIAALKNLCDWCDSVDRHPFAKDAARAILAKVQS